MPAYFDISFELNKSKTAVIDFYTALLDSGPAFKRGYLNAESDSFEDISLWNQTKLNENYERGHTDSFSNDYKQIQLKFSDFSEVRVFIMNCREASSFKFDLIVPEDDLVDWEKHSGKYVPHRQIDRMTLLKTLARSMWERLEILAIQTEWECSDCPPDAKELSAGAAPQAEPFCIIQKSSVSEIPALPFEEIGRNGVLIENPDNWLYL